METLVRSLEPKSFPSLMASKVVSPATLEEHYKLYLAYVKKCEDLTQRLAHIQCRCGTSHATEIANLKGDLTFVLAAAHNHELYFDILAAQQTLPTGPLLEAINRCFGSLQNYLADLRETARICRGWTWTVLDQSTGHLWNLPNQQVATAPLWQGRPLLALDLYEHAFFSDFGTHRLDYINTLIAHLNFKPVEARYQAALGSPD